MAALADVHRIALAPHNPTGPVIRPRRSSSASVNPIRRLRSRARRRPLARYHVVSEGFVVERQGRVVRPGSRPGLGVEINKIESKEAPI